MGSGKSTAARLFAAETGAMLIDADREAKTLMTGSGEIRRQLCDAFGPLVVVGDDIDFKKLGQIVFGSRENLSALNRIVHPPLLLHLQRLVRQDCDVILDAALVTLWGIEGWFSKRIWVHAPQEIRMRRMIAAHKGCDEAAVRDQRKRMILQESMVLEPHDKSWHRLTNDTTIEALIKTLTEVCRK
jgi:dephospho-CoA kinase